MVDQSLLLTFCALLIFFLLHYKLALVIINKTLHTAANQDSLQNASLVHPIW
jgi:hypothetical protein